MRRLSLALSCLLVVSMIAAVHAAEKPTAEYQKAMKDLGATMAALGKPGASEDFELVKTQGAAAKDAFAVTLKYWNAKGAPDAIKMSDTGAKAVADLLVSANLSSAEGVVAAMKDMGGTCQACHQAHREKTAEGFEIK